MNKTKIRKISGMLVALFLAVMLLMTTPVRAATLSHSITPVSGGNTIITVTVTNGAVDLLDVDAIIDQIQVTLCNLTHCGDLASLATPTVEVTGSYGYGYGYQIPAGGYDYGYGYGYGAAAEAVTIIFTWTLPLPDGYYNLSSQLGATESEFSEFFVGPACVDLDGDGYGNPQYNMSGCTYSDIPDCNDGDDTVYPGAPQLCDGKNNNCSDPDWPTIPSDEIDKDRDGYVECTPWVGINASILGGGDCNDSDAAIHPNATEICDDGIDNNCNGLIDCLDPECVSDPACIVRRSSGGRSRLAAPVQADEEHEETWGLWDLGSLNAGTRYRFDGEFHFTDLIFRSISTSRDYSDVWLKISKIQKPGRIPTPNGLIYSYFELSYSSLDNYGIEEIGFDLRVSKQWAEANGIFPEKVIAYRFNGFSWDELRLDYTETDNDYYYFRIYSKGLSYYAVAGLPLNVWDLLDSVDGYYSGLKDFSSVMERIAVYYR
ncbi:MAG TPA: PGF-pre-PGF domain-containing protein [Candidatus Woesearchaeota archaeon]|nr:PGF-pre-PGF domain-containing protein [Candidatus Woesearchaeota archaeon]